MSIFIDNKAALEKYGYTVQDPHTVIGPNGQPAAGMDAYGQVWFKEEGLEALCNSVVEPIVSPEVIEEIRVRARSNKGHYIKDDPNTPKNEAWTTKVLKKLRPNKKKK